MSEQVRRLTERDGDYCKDICGQAKTCKRLKAGDICDDARRYARLREFENLFVPIPEVAEMATLRYPIQPSNAFYDQSPCRYCSNNPANGGSGVCHCILGAQSLWG